MHSLRKYIRVVSAFLLINFLYATFIPTISYALTSGPTAPEATSFEPIDTTDMVNPLTGDFTYNIPLLEVPGPSGGYPLSLSYHAGIQTNEDASWVGLGWTLNPGALTRSVSGYADDMQDISNVDRSVWEGGTYSAATVGVGVGVAGAFNMTAGLSYSNDTYKGFSFVGSFGTKVGTGPFAAEAGLSASNNGEFKSTANVTVGKTLAKATRLSVTAGTSGLSGNYSAMSPDFSSVGAAINTLTGGKGAGIKAIASSRIYNSKSGKVSTKGFVLSPIDFNIKGIGFRIGGGYQRYWIDETEEKNVNGALYYPTTMLSETELDEKAFDTYDLMVVEDNEIKFTESEKYKGGSFINYDSYNVNTQGLSGSIRPYHLRSYLTRQTKLNEEDELLVRSHQLGVNTNKVHFRFENDFSNNFSVKNEENFENNAGDDLVLTYDDNDYNIGNDDEPIEGFVDNKLAGSRNINWYTNDQILDTTYSKPGYMENDAAGFVRKNNSQIGGFVITNESGVRYHFTLPAYSYDEYSYSGRIDEAGKYNFNHLKKEEPYAYTWYLTAITGPDYVDRGENGESDGELNEHDWGYWVKFQYGKWASDYAWRNPSEGFNKDVDLEFSNFSKGKKELYYLNTIETKSHVAVFEKEIRADGKSVNPEFKQAVITNGSSVADIDLGSFDKIIRSENHDINCEFGQGEENCTNTTINYDIFPRSTLKLKRVSLFKREDYNNALASISDNYDHLEIHTEEDGTEFSRYQHHFGKNVIDVHDVESEGVNFTDHILKSIAFDFDYSLCPETSNSFDPEGELYASGYDADLMNNKLGKLTLKQVNFQGKKGAEGIPPLQFQYDLENPVAGYSKFTTDQETVEMIQGNSGLEIGDIIRVPSNNTGEYFARIESINGDVHQLKQIGKNQFVGDEFTIIKSFPEVETHEQAYLNWETTINPPYNYEYYDIWGYYKSDFKFLGNDNLSRMVTPTSEKLIDAWSLKKITTSTGADIIINYEADTYKKALQELGNLVIKDVELHNASLNEVKISFYSDIGELSIDDLSVDMIGVKKLHFKSVIGEDPISCSEALEDVYVWRQYAPGTSYPVKAKGDDYIIIEHLTLAQDLENIIVHKQTGIDPVDLIPLDDNNLPQYKYEGLSLAGGEILLNSVSTINSKGGGLRTKRITLSQYINSTFTEYDYSEGVTPYEPVGYGLPIEKHSGHLADCLEAKEEEAYTAYKNEYFDAVYDGFLDLFAKSRELPGPGVYYGNVKVKEGVIESGTERYLPSYSELVYDVDVTDMVQISPEFNPDTWGTIGNELAVDQLEVPEVWNGKAVDSFTASAVKIANYTARFGSLLSSTLYDNNDNKISSTENNYLILDSDEARLKLVDDYKRQGMLQEVFSDVRFVRYEDEVSPAEDGDYKLVGVIGYKRQYPNIQIGQTTTNYKTGITNTSDNLAFDFYSGVPTKTMTRDGHGNAFVAESVPAYRQYDEMGLAIHNGKNMLTQEGASYTYKVDPNNTDVRQALISAEIQTWNDKWQYKEADGSWDQAGPANDPYQVWRKHKSYTYKGDDQAINQEGLYAYTSSSHPVFTWWDTGEPPATSQWQKGAEITLYNRYSHALEATDLNGNFAATKFDSKQEKVLATVANASYDEFAYSGAEDGELSGYFGGAVSKGVNATVYNTTDDNDINVHTGWSSVSVSSGDKAFNFTATASDTRNMKVSVWASQNDGVIKYKLNGGTTQSISTKVRTSDNWHLLTAYLPALSQGDELQVWCEAGGSAAYFDDFRVHPHNAPMTAYVYNEFDELAFVLDNNNLYTEYIYDDMGRLEETYRESFKYGRKKVSQYSVHYSEKPTTNN